MESGMNFPVTEHVFKTARHTSFYLACGAEDAPLIIFVHGWPELSISWRHQLGCFASLGFRAIAPDMRGYGRSSVYSQHSDYAVEQISTDMVELLHGLGREKAIWVGHDWGSPIVWTMASHYPEKCYGIANLCVPYIPNGFGAENLIALVDRTTYPADKYPAGQWDYQKFYEENFEKAGAEFEASIENTVKLLFRKGAAQGAHEPAFTSAVRANGGWFPGGVAPDYPRDTDLLTEQDFNKYVEALKRNGFFGPDSWYMNGDANVAFASQAKHGGRLQMPVLFLHAAYDYICYTIDTKLSRPMRANCDDLTEATVESGHWMAQEKPLDVNAALAKWVVTKFPQLWKVKFHGD